MSSGRRESVIICCASVFKDLYLVPIDHYRPDRAFVFVSGGDDVFSRTERRIYETSREEIRCKVEKRVVDTHDYESVLAEIMDIKSAMHREYGEDLDIFINITSGTHEFAAAGMFAAMNPVPAVAFRVEIDSSLSEDDLDNIISSVGGVSDVSEPVKVTCLEGDSPDDVMVRFLGVVDSLYERNRKPRYSQMIARLKDIGIWTHDPERKSNYGRTPIEKKEEMYLIRQYIRPAVEHGWLEKPSANTLRLTDKGRAYISVFSGTKLAMKGAEGSIARRNEMLCSRCMAEPDILCNMSVPDDFEYEAPEDNVVSFQRNGRSYTFRIGLE